MALETLADKSAAQPLAELLQKPGLGGHAVTTIDAALEANPRSGTDTTVRNQALSELYLARALYRCGDYEGLGEKTLREYSRDLHGHYARHAKAVLQKRHRAGGVTAPALPQPWLRGSTRSRRNESVTAGEDLGGVRPSSGAARMEREGDGMKSAASACSGACCARTGALR